MKLLNHILLMSFCLPLFTYCQRSLTPDWHQQIVSHYIKSQLNDPNSYQAGTFTIIDQQYLESQPVVANSIAALQQKYQDLFVQADLQKNLPVLKLDTLNIYMECLPQISKGSNQDELEKLRLTIEDELSYLDEVLQAFNLSVFHPIPTDSLIVYHEYVAVTEFGEYDFQSIFEIDRKDKVILAEKIFNKTQIL